MALYHYTTEKRYLAIVNSGLFRPSEDVQTDSVYGIGWYFTDLPPETCEKVLMGFCWERYTFHQRVKYYLQIEVVGGTANFRRSHVYFVPKSSSVSFRLLNHGQCPECSLKPCDTCEINPDR